MAALSPPPTGPASLLRDTAPFSHRNVPTAAEKQDLRRRLLDAGIRELPYPFASLLSIVSDVDFSDVDRYHRYQRALVHDHGLDFGDSAYLHWTRGDRRARRGSEIVEPQGLGFLPPSLREGDEAQAGPPPSRFTLLEMVAEYHRGNVDHLHGPLARGPRFVRLTAPATTTGRIVVDLLPPADDGHFAVGESDVHAIAIVAAPGVVGAAARIELHQRDGSVTRFPPAPDGSGLGRLAPDGAVEHRFLCHGDDAPPALAAAARIEVEPVADGAVTIYLLSATGDLLLRALETLARRYRVAPSLVTEHFGVFFFNEPSLAPRVERLRAALADPGAATLALYGAIDDGEVRCSTLADDPDSFACVMPALTERLGVRFVNPAGLTAAPGRRFDLHDVISPAATRSGAGLYVMRRTLPAISEAHPLAALPDDDPMVRKSRVDSLGARLASVLDESAARPGGIHPVYTHLGAVTDGRPEPEPYLEPEPLRRLQDRVLGISGDVPPSSRVWFTRASTMCDYALMLRHLAGATRRDGPDAIDIRRWRDPILGAILPASAEQLYGGTWYVDDAERATLTLDGEPVHALTRNPPDETGRPSVTIAACGIRHLLFDEADPCDQRLLAHGGVEHVGAIWTWRDEGDAFSGVRHGALRLTDGAGSSDRRRGSMRLQPRGLDPRGCQHFFCAVRPTDRHVAAAFEIETTTGGRFLFGDERLELDRPVTARYAVATGAPAPGSWRLLSVPFHDLRWSERALRPSALPSHPVRAVTIHVEGPPGAGVDLDAMHFGRPRTNGAPGAAGERFVVTGRAPERRPADRVHLATEQGAAHEAIIDRAGAFCFTGVPRGVHAIGTADVRPTKHRLVEVMSDVTGVELR